MEEYPSLFRYNKLRRHLFEKRVLRLLGARKRDLSRPYSLPKSIAESKAKFKQLNLPITG